MPAYRHLSRRWEFNFALFASLEQLFGVLDFVFCNNGKIGTVLSHFTQLERASKRWT
jgi:hypothetical protein